MTHNIETMKNHLRDNKKMYIAATIGVVVGAVTVVLLTRSRTSPEIVQKVVQLGFRNEANPTIINLLERSTASKPVHLVGTNLYFNSLSEASRETGHHLSQLSKHINGQLADLNGDVFELLQPAA
jgi:hypothetical protein